VIIPATFKPAWWLPGGHLQTLYPTFARHSICPALQRERLELVDGDFIDIDWTGNPQGPVVLVLHGLEGSLESHYTGGILSALATRGYRPGLVYFRGCSGEPNRLPRNYHSGDTGDLQTVIRHIRETCPGKPLAIIGYSLGGNVLLKWLGEQGNRAPVVTAVAVSVPFDLDRVARRLERGVSRIYQNHLLRKLRQSVKTKAAAQPAPVPIQELAALKTFRQFDDAITAPLHGFRDVDDYYSQSSSRQYLRQIETPVLVIHALDDPFLPPTAVPNDSDLSHAVTLELSPHGGHVGFVSGNIPLAGYYWLEQRICEHLQAYL